MKYYQNIITEKSWQILKELRKKYDFVLIGGWAVWLYTKTLKSKDIDIIVDYEELSKLQKDFEISKNDRLQKYEIKKEEVDIDIYLPFYSDLGIPCEKIFDYITIKEGFKMPTRELLLALKQYAFEKRQGSIKGEKDKIDILLLCLQEGFDWFKYTDILKKFNLIRRKNDLRQMLEHTYELTEANINRHAFAQAKKLILKEF